MSPVVPAGKVLSPREAAALVRPRDAVATGLGPGQTVGILRALGERTDLEDVALYTGIFVEPFALLQRPGVRVLSGFFGPVERALRSLGGRIEYVPADFHGLERLGLALEPRVVLAHTTPPDADGWLSFGVHSAATYRVFCAAARDPKRLAIAEMNPQMPRLDGLPALGGNRIHVSEVDALVEHDAPLLTPPAETARSEDAAIAERVAALVADGSTLQFGIGAIPDRSRPASPAARVATSAFTPRCSPTA
jgi:acyl-CoA hydrolase